MSNILQQVGENLADSLNNIAATSGKAAAQANEISRQAQSAQAAFNAEQANVANSIGDNRLLSQYGFNAAQAAAANQFTNSSWERTAEWNEQMWERQAEFNAEQAEIQRQWQERMANTQYQRAIKDMSKAGLNPILAVTGGGVGTGVPGGAVATVGGASMGSAQGAMASGGIIGPETAQINNYTGQLEQLTGTLGLLTAMASGMTSAQDAAETLAEGANEVIETATGGKTYQKAQDLKNSTTLWDFIKNSILNRPGSMMQDIFNTAIEKAESKKK